MKQLALILFFFMSLQGFGQQATQAKNPKRTIQMLFNGKAPDTITRKDFLTALNETYLPITFTFDTFKFEIIKYIIEFKPVNPEQNTIKEMVKGTTDEIKKLIGPFKKDLTDVKSVVISDITMMGPRGTVKLTSETTIEFKE